MARTFFGVIATVIVVATCNSKGLTISHESAAQIDSDDVSRAEVRPRVHLRSDSPSATSHAFWHEHADEWPYGDVEANVGALVEVTNGPTRVDERTNGGNWWAQYGPQGLAHDEEHYYASTRTHLFKWHRSQGLGAVLASNAHRRAKMPSQLQTDGYDHFGDPDFKNDHLYVPIEPGRKRSGPVLIAVYDRDLTIDAWDELSHSTAAPWVAVHPLNPRLIFVSEFNGSRAAPVALHVYKNEAAADSLSLRYLSLFQLHDSDGSSVVLQQIQGGEFDPGGNRLYVVAEGGTYGPGVYAFNMRTGRLDAFADQSDQLRAGHEFEGITYWDLDATTEDAGIDGQVHFLLWDHNWWPTTPDTYWSKHLRVQTGDP